MRSSQSCVLKAQHNFCAYIVRSTKCMFSATIRIDDNHTHSLIIVYALLMARLFAHTAALAALQNASCKFARTSSGRANRADSTKQPTPPLQTPYVYITINARGDRCAAISLPPARCPCAPINCTIECTLLKRTFTAHQTTRGQPGANA